MKKMMTLFLVVFLSSCGLRHSPQPPYIPISEDVIAAAGRRMEKKHGLSVMGELGRLMFRVDMLGIAFDAHRELDKDEAREIIVDCATELLKELNANPRIRPYLPVYPATLDQIEIELYSAGPGGGDAYDPYINVASCVNGKIQYATVDAVNAYGYKHKYYETYEEAVAILRGEKSFSD